MVNQICVGSAVLFAVIGGVVAQEPAVVATGVEVRVIERVYSGVPGVPPSESQVSRQIAIAPAIGELADPSRIRIVQTDLEAGSAVALAPGSYWLGSISELPTPSVGAGSPVALPPAGGLPPGGGISGEGEEAEGGAPLSGSGDSAAPNPSLGAIPAQRLTVDAGQLESVTVYLDLYAPSAPGIGGAPEPEEDPLERWQRRYFSEEERSQDDGETLLWGLEADPDRDGMKNVAEYALGSDPRSAESLTDVYQIRIETGAFRLRLLQHRSDARLVYTIDRLAALESPEGVEAGLARLGSEVFDRNYEWVTYGEETAEARLYRVRVDFNP